MLIENSVALRHNLHRNPELTWQEHQTAATIRSQLSSADIEWRTCADLGTIATFAPDAAGRHIALRADMDALPIHEETNVTWKSATDRCMHACGHDGHTATAMATAWWLKRHESTLPGPVSMLFQPAEEGGHGARKMIEDGALEGVDTIFGWHNWPAIPFGKAICPDGTVMSANGTFAIIVKGIGGHASQPELCRDPVLGAAAIVVALQQIVSRRLPPQQAAVISVTSIEAPSSDTVIPDHAQIGGSFRIADNALRETIHHHIAEVAQDVAKAHGVEVEVEMHPRYLATINHNAEAKIYRHALAHEFGTDWNSTQTSVPIMASEDFSYYLAEIPGAFALIGADDGEHIHQVPCHSPNYDFNDNLIPAMARVYLRLAGAPLPD